MGNQVLSNDEALDQVRHFGCCRRLGRALVEPNKAKHYGVVVQPNVLLTTLLLCCAV